MNFRVGLLLAAPVCFFAYGILRMIGRMDGHYGLGLDWQLAHGAFLLGLVLFVPAVLFLRRRIPAGRIREAVVVITLLGIGAAMVQFIVDMVVGFLADTDAEMSALSDRFHAIPGVDWAFYIVGPQLMHVGLLLLAVLLAWAKELPWWSPVLILVGGPLPVFGLDLIPLAALAYLAAFAPIALRRRPERLRVARSSAA